MRIAAAFSLGMLLACVHAHEPALAPIVPVSARSLNHHDLDIYLLCGDRDAIWLGTIPERGAGSLEVPGERLACVPGLRFFLVDWERHRGYWVGRFWPRRGSRIYLVIERYAGLSRAAVRDARQ